MVITPSPEVTKSTRLSSSDMGGVGSVMEKCCSFRNLSPLTNTPLTGLTGMLLETGQFFICAILTGKK